MWNDEEDGEDYRGRECEIPWGDGVCPECGAITVNCVVADNACSKCDYVEEVYTGTIYG